MAGEPGIGEVTDDEPGPARQAEQRGPLGGLLESDGREIHSDQGGVRGAGEPEAGTAAAAAQVDQGLPGSEVQGLSHVTEQAVSFPASAGSAAVSVPASAGSAGGRNSPGPPTVSCGVMGLGDNSAVADEEVREPSHATGAAALRAGWSHRHRDVSGGWLRPTVFGAVDGLVTNASLIAGVGGGGVSSHAVVLTGVAALVAGAFSMGTGEYISVTNQNELVQAEVALEQKMLARFPAAEQEELAGYFREYGADPETAARID